MGIEYSVIVPLVVILPILLPPYSVNHRLPSGPAVIPSGWLPELGSVYSVMVPRGRDLADAVAAVLGEPQVAVGSRGDPERLAAEPLGRVYSVIVPLVVILPILLPLYSVNQRLPSGPAVMPSGELEPVGIVYSVNDPPVVTLPILLPLYSVNHSLPSGPCVMAYGLLDEVGMV